MSEKPDKEAQEKIFKILFPYAKWRRESDYQMIDSVHQVYMELGYRLPKDRPEPKPDESRLLTDEEIILKEVQIPTGDDIGGKPIVLIEKDIDIDATLAKQRDLTASIIKHEYDKLVLEAYDKGYNKKDAECRQRVEEARKQDGNSFVSICVQGAREF